MKKIILYGELAEKFGKEIKLCVDSVGEAVRALEANFPGQFVKAIKEGTYKIAKSKNHYGIPKEELTMKLGWEEIHIEPVLQGAGGGGDSKGKGTLNIVLGVVLIAASFFVPAAGVFGIGLLTSGVVFGVGASLALSGVSSLLTPVPKVSSESLAGREKPEERPSFLFKGAVNNTEQGGPVPLIYGTHRVGSVVLSAGLTSEDIG